jgi:hypothetical protein
VSRSSTLIAAKRSVTLEAGCQYHTFRAQDEAAFMVLANPCAQWRLELNDILQWWDAAKHLVLAKYPIPHNCEPEVHLITEVITSPQWLRHYQATGQHGIHARAGGNIQGLGSFGVMANGSVQVIRSTSGVAQSAESGNYVCFTRSISCKRKRFLGVGLQWAAMVYQFDPI